MFWNTSISFLPCFSSHADFVWSLRCVVRKKANQSLCLRKEESSLKKRLPPSFVENHDSTIGKRLEERYGCETRLYSAE